ncbi:MAG TPA: hypothetical protein VK158_00520 [Acidobacteriota bacterium]|nr:hypothetical protein [Acidobacteriota bacterium]
MKTTIQISTETLKRLSSHKRFSRESYDDVLNFILDEYEDEPLSAQDVESIQRGLDNIKKGEVHTLENLAKEYGIKL